jgi:hypothetical protein
MVKSLKSSELIMESVRAVYEFRPPFCGGIWYEGNILREAVETMALRLV